VAENTSFDLAKGRYGKIFGMENKRKGSPNINADIGYTFSLLVIFRF
jgi:hypothetical protein